jgi:Ca2+-binding EF-hand superfamily protein
MLYSPNGEPLNGGPLGRPTCAEALSRWFDRVDTNHDNKLSHEEFMTDAVVQFSRMDIDKNGYLVSEELERYRAPYRQDLTTTASASPASDADNQSHKGRHGKSGESHPETSQRDAADPVLSADTNNDFKVTPQEFMTQAEKIFTALDTEHEGFVTREEVMKTCEQNGKR